jgi:hypothetical protein
MPTKRITRQWEPELSDQEIHFIGTIFVQWASMEHEIFMQTFLTFVPEITDPDQLPKAMNNIQFTGVLDLWNERVAKNAVGRRAQVLQRQHGKILRLKDTRDALAHGMWHWSAVDLGQISTTRVRKREVITSHFTAEMLYKFAGEIAEINFKLRFPGGIIDLARARMKEGGYVSRNAMAMFTSSSGRVIKRRVRVPKTDA